MLDWLVVWGSEADMGNEMLVSISELLVDLFVDLVSTGVLELLRSLDEVDSENVCDRMLETRVTEGSSKDRVSDLVVAVSVCVDLEGGFVSTTEVGASEDTTDVNLVPEVVTLIGGIWEKDEDFSEDTTKDPEAEIEEPGDGDFTSSVDVLGASEVF